MSPARLILLAAAALLPPAAAHAQKAAPAAPINYPAQPTGDVPVFPKDQIKPGMIGYTFTVMQGSTVVPVRTRVVGVAAGGLGPGLDMIIGILDDPKTDLTGAVHGMSGSPLYLADPATGQWKMAGALSRRIAMFEKDGHCGFTPIEDMLAVRAKLTEAPQPGSLPQRLGAAPLVPAPAVATNETEPA